MTSRGLALVLCVFVLRAGTAASAQTVTTPDSAQTPATTAAPQPEPEPQREPDRPLTHLFQNFARDARRLPSIETAVSLGIGGALALAVHPADDEVYEHVTEAGPRGFYEVGSVLGDGWVQIGFAVGTYATGLVARERELTHFGSDLIRAQALNAVFTQGLKFAVRRERPGGSTSHSYSMPSGHTSSTFATAAVVWRHYGWKAGLPVSALGAWVGAGRVQLGKHYLSDVVLGAAIGTVAGRAVTIGHGRSRLALSPARVPGGAALMFTLVER